nr:XdhC/CoxI family protein [uncultured Merdimonas sp.]
MRQLFHILKKLSDEGQDMVLVEVVESTGSVPRKAGAWMVVTDQGRNAGTIGGGAVEYAGIQRSRRVLKEKKSCLEEYHLDSDQAAKLGMVCGGSVKVHFQYLPWNDPAIAGIGARVEQVCEEGTDGWLVRRLSGGSWMPEVRERSELPEEVVGKGSGRVICLEEDGSLHCYEKIWQPGVVYIFGGGHVAQALVPVLASVDFHCVVLEDRQEFLDRKLFPDAWDVRRIRNDRILEEIRIGREDYVCIMTRGHKDDMLIQAQVLSTPASYIGVIGSRRKAAAVAKKLEEEYQIPPEEIARVHTPIGLDIGAETPEEIAVSIAAELIRHRAELRAELR